MTPFSASPRTTIRVIRPFVDDDMRRAMRHARVRRQARRKRWLELG